jgi:hypothetical protein
LLHGTQGDDDVVAGLDVTDIEIDLLFTHLYVSIRGVGRVYTRAGAANQSALIF